MHQRSHKAKHIKAAAGSLHQHTAAEGSKNYAHIFHGRVSKHALNIRFHLSIEYAQKCRYYASQQYSNAPPVIPGRQKAEHKTAEAIKSNLQHNTAHQRGNVTGCCRMRLRQPHMQRHQTGLQSKTGKGTDKNKMLPAAIQCILGHSSKAEALAGRACQQKGNHNRRRTDAGHNQILIGSIPGSTLFGFMVNQHKGGYSHNLPEKQEAEGIACQQHQYHRHYEQAPHAAQKTQTAAIIATRITKRVQAGNNTGDTGQKQKDCAPAIAA